MLSLTSSTLKGINRSKDTRPNSSRHTQQHHRSKSNHQNNYEKVSTQATLKMLRNSQKHTPRKSIPTHKGTVQTRSDKKNASSRKKGR